MVANMPNGSTQDDVTPQPGGGGRLLARRYRLGSPVGRGGMGTVWEAYDEVLGRDVAVKEVVLPFGLTDEERDTQYKRTFREARTAARLGHPGVIAVYDVVEEDGRPWIIMELVRARSLDKVIKEDGVLPWQRAAELGRQMLAALHAAHEAGVLHRDVKPSNVLLDDSGIGERAVLTDFGIATSVGDTTLTTTGLVLGSPAYIAPERARGKTVGPASDLWSLGVTLYAMLAGRSPFERSEPMASLVAIISDEPPWIEQSGPLWPVIEGLLRKDPDQRLTHHQTAKLLEDVLRGEGPTLHVNGAEAALPEVAEPDPAAVTTGASGSGPDTIKVKDAAKGRRGLFWAVAALIAVIAAGTIAVFANSSSGGGPAKRNPAPAALNPPGQAPSPSASGSPSPADTTVPDGFRAYQDDTGFATVVPKDWSNDPRRDDGTVVVQSADGSARITFSTHPGSASALDTLKNRGDQGQAQYSVVRVAPATSGPLADPTGAKSAELEYTWESNSGRQHVLVRDFEANGHDYEIMIRVADGSWASMIQQLMPVISHFRTTG